MSDLTRVEAEVLRMMAEGYRAKEIASFLHTNVGHVKRVKTSLYNKLSAKGGENAVAIAFRNGFIS